MEADESAPMPTKGHKGADFRNQTTEGAKQRFPWTTIAVVAVIVIVIVTAILTLGSS